NWDCEFEKIAGQVMDMCPHSILYAIIDYLQGYGAKFLDSTLFLKDTLAHEGNISGVEIGTHTRADIEFGINLARKYVELDVGQTVIVKNKTAVALECIEGTDIAIRRAHRLAGKECIVIKFCTESHDFRFDVPVVGMKTLYLLKKTKSAALILPANRVIILEKDRFIRYAKENGIPVIGII
ncbi:MAG: LpxI family protein, partial [Candidatus Omnitrophica bacterium]|nr:LpxI family protein [Candidatus Omnitrophota bacterium]